MIIESIRNEVLKVDTNSFYITLTYKVGKGLAVSRVLF